MLVTAVILALVLLTLIGLSALLGGSTTQMRVLGVTFGAAIVLLFGFAWRRPSAVWRWSSYRLAPDGVQIRTGVYWRQVIHVARSRIQHTDVSQGPLERRYGLATLTIHTAGTANAQVQLRGLAAGLAYRIRDALHPTDRGDGV